MSNSTCSVCCEKMKKQITCNLCDFTACYKCFSKYIIESTVNPKCMNCNKPWSRKNLVNSFGQNFVINKYKKKRENVLFDIERAMLHEAQPLAARERTIAEMDKVIMKLQDEIQNIEISISRLTVGILDSEFEEFLENRKILQMQKHSLNEEKSNLYYRRNRILQKTPKNEKKTSSIVIKCTNTNCKGYTNGTCTLCKTKICKECHEVLIDNENHECLKENIETVKLISKECKNCPSCKFLIYKIDGCDQMFCTQCKTAFSWKTGEICVGKIHNPHYYEWIRMNGTQMREIGDIPCGGLPYANRFIAQNNFLSVVHRAVSHVENYEMHRLNNETNNVNGNIDLRIAYLNNNITEEMFKQEIYKREKALEKKREILTILNTFVVVCSDIFRTLVIPNNQECKTEFENIRNFTNESMYDVSRVYKCVVPIINNNWYIINERYIPL